ncbi:MAG: NAD(+) diphosphatase [Desulfobacterales bacterium]
MPFEPGFIPGIQATDRAWWFLFQENKLLIDARGGGLAIPRRADFAGLLPRLTASQSLGRLNGEPAFAAALTNGARMPAGMQFRSVRSLFGGLTDELYQAAGYAFQILDWHHRHHFCSRCGAPLLDKPDERARQCRRCNLTVYPRINPCIIVAVVKDDQLLLVRRRAIAAGRYSVVAGYVEAGETLEDCLRREVLEEAGIRVDRIAYFGSQPWPYSSSLMVAFTAEYAGGEIRVDGREISDAGWFRAHRLPPVPGWGSIAAKLIDWFAQQAPKQAGG